MRTTIWESIHVGFDALLVHPKRTLLSTTGIVIGVLALVATFAVTDGVDVWSRRLIERESSVQDILVTARRAAPATDAVERIHAIPVLTLDNWRTAWRSSPDVSAAMLSYSGDAVVRTIGRRREATFVLGTANIAEFSGLELADGRFFSDAEVGRDVSVIVLGHRLAAELAAPHDPLWLIGRMVWVGTRRREVVGVLAARPGELDLQAFAPLGQHPDLAANGARRVTPTLRFKAASIEQVTGARDAVVDWIARRFGRDRDALEVTVGLERLQNAAQAILLAKLIFGLLVALMLTIGGIGIMNVLLASVAERTREIGIRKAIGARGRDVLVHFLAEATAIAGMGSAVGFVGGVLVALSATAIFRRVTDAQIHAVFRAPTVALAIASAVVVGLVFGIYPALTAARLTPIEAIQRE